jgi:hypothetical protein
MHVVALHHKCKICGKTAGQHRSKDQACPSGLKTKIGYTSYAKTKFEPKELSQKEQEAELKRFKI